MFALALGLEAKKLLYALCLIFHWDNVPDNINLL